MKKNYLFFVFILISSLTISCSGGDDSASSNNNNQQIIPSNLQVSLTIEGENSQNPNGDGSGLFYGIATASDAVYYTFKIGNGSTFSGIIKGVTDTGKLSVWTEDDIIKTFDLKEVSLLY